MRLVKSNGRVLEVREVGEESHRILAVAAPLPIIVDRVMSDEEARALWREIVQSGLYRVV